MPRTTCKGPLRRIIGYVGLPLTSGPQYLLANELLECGHAQRAVKDIYGETVASRRRCAKCSSQAIVKPELAELAKQWKESGESGLVRHPDPLGTEFQSLAA